MDKPDVDSIEGLSPAISIDQKTTSRNPRSTVGTVTEIYDYLRLLWARVGKPHCPICGRPIVGQSAEQIIDQVMELAEGTRFMVLAPVVRGRKGEYGKLLEELRADGFARVKIDDRVRMLEESIVLDKRYKHDISVVVDRLVMRHDVRKRLADSIETAVALADGLVEIEIVGAREGPEPTTAEAARHADRGARARARRRRRSSPARRRSRARSSRSPSASPAPSTARRWSSSSRGSSPSTRRTAPAIAAPGLGSQMEIDPELVVPDPSLSIGEGALAPWANSTSNYYEQVTEAIAERYGVDLEAPWEELPDEQRELFLDGTNGEPVQVTYRNRYGRRRSYATRFEGIVKNLERRYRETDSEWTREKIEEFMSLRPCPVCGGARLRPESRAVLVGGHADRGVLRAVGAAGAGVAGGGRAVGDRSPRRAADPARDLRAPAVPGERRHRLPLDGPRRGDAVGRRGAADPPGDADRLLARRRALHPRRALDRPAPARQLEADRDARAAARQQYESPKNSNLGQPVPERLDGELAQRPVDRPAVGESGRRS